MSIRAQALFGARADEPLILVDDAGAELGSVTLAEAHLPPGRRHRAFSVYLFDEEGHMLVHRRHRQKPLWGGFWTNSCCSHPHFGEAVERAAVRRAGQELGLSSPALAELFAYEYRAEFEDIGVEHEWVHVFGGRAERDAVEPEPTEMDAVQWLTPHEVDALIAGEMPTSPWFELAWPRVREALEAGRIT